MSRHLSSNHRRVALDRLDEYLAAWQAVREAVLEAGGNAWLFRGEAREDQFLEFVEFAERKLFESARVYAARRELDETIGHGREASWEEVSTT